MKLSNGIIIKLTFSKNGNLISGYLTENRSSEFYPSADKATIFGDLAPAMNAVNKISGKYDLESVSYINLSSKDQFNLKSTINIDDLKSVIGTYLSNNIDLKKLDISISDEGLSITWNKNNIFVSKKDGILFSPGFYDVSNGFSSDFNETIVNNILQFISYYNK